MQIAPRVCSFDGIVKLDVTAPAGKGWVSNIKLRGHAIGEPFFVPRDAEAMQRGVAHDPYYATDSDDGWLLAWTVEKASGKCQCMVRRWTRCACALAELSARNI